MVGSGVICQALLIIIYNHKWLTKIVSFYKARMRLLNKSNIKYDNKNLKEMHEIVNWIIIHKSIQFKDIR